MLKKLFNIPTFAPLMHKLQLQKFLIQNQALKMELAKLQLIHSGVEVINGKEIPFVVLNNKTILYGRFPSQLERNMYFKWKSQIAEHLTENTIRVGMDVIMRYLYPHAMPHFTMPYSRNQRRHFHNQHIETINDLPNISEKKKQELIKIYEVRMGENFLDVGAYMGYGGMRMSQEIGQTGKVLAVEADEEARFLLELNVKANNINNISVVPVAVSNKDGFTTFYKTERQANSLIPNVVNSNNGYKVNTLSIDSILKNASLPIVSRISITINGAEVEAVEGMKETINNNASLRISAAGWYKRDGRKVSELLVPKLREYGLNVEVGIEGGVLAWK